MQNSTMKVWLDSSYLAGANQSYIEQLYENFLTDPGSIEGSWQAIFKQLSHAKIKTDPFHSQIRNDFRQLKKNTISGYSTLSFNQGIHLQQCNVLQLIHSFRCYGHQEANLDPLGLWRQEKVPFLNPSHHSLSSADFQKSFNVGSFAIGKKTMKLGELYSALKSTYCGSIGVEYMHISDVRKQSWLQERIESVSGCLNFTRLEKRCFLSELTAAEGLERYIGAKFPGAKRFSLEGADVLIPMLKEIVRHASKNGIRELVLAMAHRGRLNVLINVLGKKPVELFDEFAGKYHQYIGTGDVKYHQGFSSKIETESGIVSLALAFNPSHLEIINPVVMGYARARHDCLNEMNHMKALPITIHGDAAIIGQGVVQETLNMSRVEAYKVDGTVRIIINNQIGFTISNVLDSRSTQYCSDVAKMVQAPIFHVNADDLEAVMFVARLALDFRDTFKCDAIIDLVCYRRNGHNEADEPSATQPIMYKKIKKHPTLREIYADTLAKEKIVSSKDAVEMVNTYRNALDHGDCVVEGWQPIHPNYCTNQTWPLYLNQPLEKEGNQSRIEMKHLQKLARLISSIPKRIEMQSRIAKIYCDRAEMASGKKLFDWGAAEMLAYATVLDKGIPIRISGEDSQRGTFFHRHAVIHDQSNGSTYVPLLNIHDGQGAFNIWDSVLSEEAALAFEYGYATTNPRTLTIWEAQFGDFANGAQVVIDQFISSGEQKWGYRCGLVMLLPHGYEGQGPEHSSARLERYLQLCAENNMQVCIPSTPSQIYHLLRRQALSDIRCPLVIMSPKSLLRHPLAVSSLEELVNTVFLSVIGEIDALDEGSVKQVILCSGKVYYDLLAKRRQNGQKDVAIIRIEQLYPFPHKALQTALNKYEHVHRFVWCQEEPLNQGAWYCTQHYLQDSIPSGASLNYIGRTASAAPAVGYIFLHHQQQQALVNEALCID